MSLEASVSVRSLAGQVIAAACQPGVYRATKFVSPTLVIKATRRRYAGKLLRGHERHETVLVTMGRPNYRERHFLQQCRQSQTPLTVRKIQLARLHA